MVARVLRRGEGGEWMGFEKFLNIFEKTIDKSRKACIIIIVSAL